MAEEEEAKEDDGVNFEYCESCGIQLNRPEDHGGNDPDNKWCKECCNKDGSHKSKEEVKKRVIKLITGPEAYPAMGEKIENEEEAEKLAEDYMKKMPAWLEKSAEEKKD